MSIKPKSYLAFKITTAHKPFVCHWTGTRFFTFSEPSVHFDVRYYDFYRCYWFFFGKPGKPYMICDSAV